MFSTLFTAVCRAECVRDGKVVWTDGFTAEYRRSNIRWPSVSSTLLLLPFLAVLSLLVLTGAFTWMDAALLMPVIGVAVVTTAGKNKYLDATLKTGLASPLWYIGLKDTGTAVVGDTMASHSNWATLNVYSNTYRPTWTPGTIASGSVDNSGSPAAFTINTGDDVYGAFIVDEHTKAGSTGTLLAAGDFTSPQAVLSGDTLNVTFTLSMS